MKVVGIDPAPSKKSTVYDDEKGFQHLDFRGLSGYLEDLPKDVLICWDAPLSFDVNNPSPFSQRILEKFFARGEGCKTPDGISVMGYSGCPHWMISQYLLGHPKVNPFPSEDSRYQLVFKKEDIKGKCVTEVHPAVAMWLWTKNKASDYHYKKKKNEQNLRKLIDMLPRDIIKEQVINNDDELDAYLAWKLGEMWVSNEENEVGIIGDNQTGSFLLPFDDKIENKFKIFSEKVTKDL